MKTLIIKLTDSCYEKVMRYEVEAPTQIIESIRQGKDAIEEFMKHYRQGRKDERAIQEGRLMQSFNPD
jgi:hypothetical protein